MSEKLSRNKKYAIFVAAIVLSGFHASASASEISPSKKHADLYATCKKDLEDPDFNNTACGMYLEGFKTSLKFFLIYFVPIASYDPSVESAPPAPESSGNRTLDEMVKIHTTSCKLDRGLAKKAAEDLVSDTEKRLRNSEKPQEPNTFLWAYFLGCGDTSRVYETFGK